MIRLFLGSLGGEGVVVGLGERLRLTLLAVLLSQFRQSLPMQHWYANRRLTFHLAKRRSIWPRRSAWRRGPSLRDRRTVRAAMAR